MFFKKISNDYLNSNRGPLVLELTALPSESQPLATSTGQVVVEGDS